MTAGPKTPAAAPPETIPSEKTEPSPRNDASISVGRNETQKIIPENIPAADAQKTLEERAAEWAEKHAGGMIWSTRKLATKRLVEALTAFAREHAADETARADGLLEKLGEAARVTAVRRRERAALEARVRELDAIFESVNASRLALVEKNRALAAEVDEWMSAVASLLPHVDASWYRCSREPCIRHDHRWREAAQAARALLDRSTQVSAPAARAPQAVPAESRAGGEHADTVERRENNPEVAGENPAGGLLSRSSQVPASSPGFPCAPNEWPGDGAFGPEPAAGGKTAGVSPATRAAFRARRLCELGVVAPGEATDALARWLAVFEASDRSTPAPGAGTPAPGGGPDPLGEALERAAALVESMLIPSSRISGTHPIWEAPDKIRALKASTAAPAAPELGARRISDDNRCGRCGQPVGPMVGGPVEAAKARWRERAGREAAMMERMERRHTGDEGRPAPATAEDTPTPTKEEP